MSGLAFTVREAAWQTDAELLRAIRHEVFVVEQSVPASLEFEGDDDQYRHVIAIGLDNDPIGTGRISSTGKIGRMAVLKTARGQGVGSAILRELMQLAATLGIENLTLSSQLHALPFYRRHGFVEFGDIFLEASIAHRRMKRSTGER